MKVYYNEQISKQKKTIYIYTNIYIYRYIYIYNIPVSPNPSQIIKAVAVPQGNGFLEGFCKDLGFRTTEA